MKDSMSMCWLGIMSKKVVCFIRKSNN